MTAKEALQALIDGKRIARKNSRNYMYLAKGKLLNKFSDGTDLVVIDFSEGDSNYCFEIAPEPILDKEEKAYLGAVIKPFRDNVLNIRKMARYISGGITYESIRIETRDGFTTLPSFKKDTMYKGMEKDRKYTLEELEL